MPLPVKSTPIGQTGGRDDRNRHAVVRAEASELTADVARF